MYAIKGYDVPEFSRQARGIPIINLLNIEQNEKITAVIPVQSMDPEEISGVHLFFATRQGIVKKTALSDYSNIRKNGLIAIHLRDDDEVVGVKLTDGAKEIMMVTRQGLAIRFPESDVRNMGRAATGVKGIQLSGDDQVIAMDVAEDDHDVLAVTSRGYGKRTPVKEYRAQTRGGKGIKTMNCTKKNGQVIEMRMVTADDDMMIITQSGVAIRIHVKDISTQSRNTQGVRLINVDEGQEVATVGRVVAVDGDDDEDILDE
jgi:DNA gyrase subunit A